MEQKSKSIFESSLSIRKLLLSNMLQQKLPLNHLEISLNQPDLSSKWKEPEIPVDPTEISREKKGTFVLKSNDCNYLEFKMTPKEVKLFKTSTGRHFGMTMCKCKHFKSRAVHNLKFRRAGSFCERRQNCDLVSKENSITWKQFHIAYQLNQTIWFVKLTIRFFQQSFNNLLFSLVNFSQKLVCINRTTVLRSNRIVRKTKRSERYGTPKLGSGSNFFLSVCW